MDLNLGLAWISVWALHGSQFGPFMDLNLSPAWISKLWVIATALGTGLSTGHMAPAREVHSEPFLLLGPVDKLAKSEPLSQTPTGPNKFKTRMRYCGKNKLKIPKGRN